MTIEQRMTPEMRIGVAVVIVIIIVFYMWHCGYIVVHMPKMFEGFDVRNITPSGGKVNGNRAWNA